MKLCKRKSSYLNYPFCRILLFLGRTQGTSECVRSVVSWLMVFGKKEGKVSHKIEYCAYKNGDKNEQRMEGTMGVQ